jgi:hypothetical protein
MMTEPINPELYECAECSAKPGRPTLCRRCVIARDAAGDDWMGSLYAQHNPTHPQADGVLLPIRLSKEEAEWLYAIAGWSGRPAGDCVRSLIRDEYQNRQVARWAQQIHRRQLREGYGIEDT